jgi:hypothetical protein
MSDNIAISSLGETDCLQANPEFRIFSVDGNTGLCTDTFYVVNNPFLKIPLFCVVIAL